MAQLAVGDILSWRSLVLVSSISVTVAVLDKDSGSTRMIGVRLMTTRHLLDLATNVT